MPRSQFGDSVYLLPRCVVDCMRARRLDGFALPGAQEEADELRGVFADRAFVLCLLGEMDELTSRVILARSDSARKPAAT